VRRRQQGDCLAIDAGRGGRVAADHTNGRGGDRCTRRIDNVDQHVGALAQLDHHRRTAFRQSDHLWTTDQLTGLRANLVAATDQVLELERSIASARDCARG
jgi:hypothetical protein